MKIFLILGFLFFFHISNGNGLPARVLFDFEQNTCGWTLIEDSSASATIEIDREHATENTGCLKLSANFPGETGIKVLLNETWNGYQSLSFDMIVTETPISQIRFFVYIKDKEWLWYQTNQKIVNYGINKVSINISGSSLDLIPKGHKKPWNQYSLDEIKEIGIKFVSDEKFSQTIYIDNIRLSPVLFSSVRFNSTEIPVYERFEISFQTAVYFENPFDPDCIAIDGYFISPSGKEIRVPGFFYQDFYFAGLGAKGQDNLKPQGIPQWKIRFSPCEQGVYKFHIVASIDKGSEIISTQQMIFKAIPSRNHGFIQTSKKDNRYFEFDDGTFFYPIGHNIRSLSDNRYSQITGKPLAAQTGTVNFDTWLSDMEANKENFFETWMSAWWLAIEWKKGYEFYEGLLRYNMRNAWKIDWILEKSEKRNIFIQLLLINHGAVSTYCDQEWQDSPYNIKNGGFLNSPEEFFTDERAKTLFKKRLRYIVARWGYSPNIFSWELVNEMDLIGENGAFFKKDILTNWYAEIGDYLAQIDPWNHMITGHYTGLYDSPVFKLSQVDYVLTNGYYGAGDNIVEAVKRVVNFNARFNKPHFISEYGGNWNAGALLLLEADIHNGIWAACHLPFAAVPLYWWHNYIEENNCYFYYKALANYMSTEDRLRIQLQPKNIIISGENSNKIKYLCMAGEARALIWIYKEDRLSRPPLDTDPLLTKNNTCSIEGLISGDYMIEFWDTYKGTITETKQIKNDGTVVFQLPDLHKDFAIKVYKINQS